MYNQFQQYGPGSLPTESSKTNVVDPFSQMYMDLEINQKKAEMQVKLALAEKSIAEAFQVKAQTLLWGLNEIRLALNFAQIDSTKENSDLLDKDKIPLKGIFSTEEQQSSLRIRYINQLDLYLRYVKQIDPQQLVDKV